MPDLNTLVSGIEYKTRKLVKEIEKVKQENRQLEEENRTLTQKLTDKENEILILQDKLKVLRITKTIESEKENDLAKGRINELLEEVDKCIALINK